MKVAKNAHDISAYGHKTKHQDNDGPSLSKTRHGIQAQCGEHCLDVRSFMVVYDDHNAYRLGPQSEKTIQACYTRSK